MDGRITTAGAMTRRADLAATLRAPAGDTAPLSPAEEAAVSDDLQRADLGLFADDAQILALM